MAAKNLLVNNCSGCHASNVGRRGYDEGIPQGLDLSTHEAVQRTAIGRPAHQTIRGPSTTSAYASPPLFGVNMPLIDSGNPGNSYVVYKMLSLGGLGDVPVAYAASESPRFPVDAALPGGGRAIEDLQRLQSVFVAGEAMPPGGMDVDDIRTIQRWIQEGAPPADASCETVNDDQSDSKLPNCACQKPHAATVDLATCPKADDQVAGFTWDAAQAGAARAVAVTACKTDPEAGFLFATKAELHSACDPVACPSSCAPGTVADGLPCDCKGTGGAGGGGGASGAGGASGSGGAGAGSGGGGAGGASGKAGAGG